MLTWKNTIDAMLEDSGKLLLRLAIAGLMLFHGIAKLTGGLETIEGMLTNYSLPTFLVYGVYFGEIVAPLMLLAGFLTRIAALVFAFNMLVAIAIGHASEVFSLGPYGGYAVELQLLYLLGAIVIAMIGPGKYAMRRGKGWMA